MNSQLHFREERGSLLDKIPDVQKDTEVTDNVDSPNSQTREHFGYTAEEKLAIQKQDYVKKV